MRTQIALDPVQHARVKQKAASLGITMAEYIRRLVDQDLDEAAPETSPVAIIGIGRSGGSDIGRSGGSDIGRSGGSDIGRSGGSDIGRSGGSDIGRSGGSDIAREGKHAVAEAVAAQHRPTGS